MKKVLFLMVSVLVLGLVFAGCGDIAKISNPATVNTGGNLYKCECFGNDSATGLGTRIKTQGKWFMYNEYPGECDWTSHSDWDSNNTPFPDTCYFNIQAGNPKKRLNLIGKYWILDNGNDTFTAEYWIDPAFVVVDKHLAISDSPNFTAAPGQDDNADFFVPFEADGEFFVFAHFAVECAE